MKAYVTGLMFNGSDVALILKKRPVGQAGYCNGIGGKVEEGEQPRMAMVRGFREETGADTFESDWTKLAIIVGQTRVMTVYKAFRGVRIESVTDEHVAWFPYNRLPSNRMPYLDWLIPLALSSNLELPIIFKDNT